jgi:hypothetical protein
MEVVTFEEGIRFGSDGNAERFFTRGWASPQDNPTLTWTVAHVAALSFRVPSTRSSVRVEVQCLPFLGNGAVQHQEGTLYINGLWFGFIKSSSPELHTFELPRDALAARGNLLSVVIPTAISPAGLGISEDTRLLGFAFETISFKA